MISEEYGELREFNFPYNGEEEINGIRTYLLKSYQDQVERLFENDQIDEYREICAEFFN